MFYLSFFRFTRGSSVVDTRFGASIWRAFIEERLPSWKNASIIPILSVGLCGMATYNVAHAVDTPNPPAATRAADNDSTLRDSAPAKRAFSKKVPMTHVESVANVQQSSFFSSDAVEVLVVESFPVPSSQNSLHRSTRLTRLPMNAAVARQASSEDGKDSGSIPSATQGDGTMPLLPPLPSLPDTPSEEPTAETSDVDISNPEQPKPAVEEGDSKDDDPGILPGVHSDKENTEEVEKILDSEEKYPMELPNPTETVKIPSVSDSLSGPKVVMIPPAVETTDNAITEPAEEVGDHMWSGIVGDEQRRILVPADGIIRTADTFELLWKYWAGTAPKPDFDPKTQLVLVATVDGPNQALGVPVLGDNGRVEFAVGGTSTAGPGFGWRMAILPKEGIQQINGHAFSEIPTEWACGDILIPKEQPSFQNATLVITLFRTNTRRSSLPADRVSQMEIPEVSHTQWKNDRHCFGLGIENSLKESANYYITVSLKQNDHRTHEGLYEGQKLAKVLTEKSPTSVHFVIQPIQ